MKDQTQEANDSISTEVSNSLKKKVWSEEEDKKIKNVPLINNRKMWSEIIPQLNNKTAQDCISRYKATCFNRGKFTPEEDNKLLKIHSELGHDWAQISRRMGSRNWKQVRDRYMNYLDPNINQKPFTISEDVLIFDIFEICGSKWKLYPKFMPGRTPDIIKNRYNSSIKGKEIKISLYKHIELTSDN
jgi:hypothetical protein